MTATSQTGTVWKFLFGSSRGELCELRVRDG